MIALNCRDGDELERAERKDADWTIKQKGTTSYSIIGSTGLGKVLVCDGLVYLYNHLMLLDRNMALMMKDVAGGRFQALLRTHFHCGPQARNVLLNVFHLGDKLLRTVGSKAYLALKMVEAVSSDAAQQFLSSERRDFPKFTAYREHLDKTEASLEEEISGTGLLFSAIRQTEDLESYLNIYGSYRLWGHPFLDYVEGLNKLHGKTTLENGINKAYVRSGFQGVVLPIFPRENMVRGQREPFA